MSNNNVFLEPSIPVLDLVPLPTTDLNPTSRSGWLPRGVLLGIAAAGSMLPGPHIPDVLHPQQTTVTTDHVTERPGPVTTIVEEPGVPFELTTSWPMTLNFSTDSPASPEGLPKLQAAEKYILSFGANPETRVEIISLEEANAETVRDMIQGSDVDKMNIPIDVVSTEDVEKFMRPHTGEVMVNVVDTRMVSMAPQKHTEQVEGCIETHQPGQATRNEYDDSRFSFTGPFLAGLVAAGRRGRARRGSTAGADGNVSGDQDLGQDGAVPELITDPETADSYSRLQCAPELHQARRILAVAAGIVVVAGGSLGILKLVEATSENAPTCAPDMVRHIETIAPGEPGMSVSAQ